MKVTCPKCGSEARFIRKQFCWRDNWPHKIYRCESSDCLIEFDQDQRLKETENLAEKERCKK